MKCDRCGDVKERTPKKKEPEEEEKAAPNPWTGRHGPTPVPPRRRRFAPTLPTGWTLYTHEGPTPSDSKAGHLCANCSMGLTEWMADGGEK